MKVKLTASNPRAFEIGRKSPGGSSDRGFTDSGWTPYVALQSSNVAGCRFNTMTHSLEITFNNGGVYLYENVSPTTYQALLGALSPGKFVHQRIKGRHRTVRVS